MAIWKLKPIDLNHREWDASTYRGEVIIRAESEERARQVAANAFRIAANVIPGEKVCLGPWTQTALVSANEVRDENYPDTGNEEIVGPQEALEYFNA